MVSKSCNDLAFDIWSWSVKKGIWLSASYVPGVENNIADLKSRYFYGNKEWSLNPYMFEKVCEKFGKPEIDFFTARLKAKCERSVSFKPDQNEFSVDALTNKEWSLNPYMFEKVCEKFGKPEIDFFAARLKAKCERSVSFKPDQYEFAVDASTQNWNDIKGYAFPPFRLIGRTLAKIKRDEASVIVVVPCWQTQPWFLQFLRMVEHGTVPVFLKANHKLLQLPGTGQTHGRNYN